MQVKDEPDVRSASKERLRLWLRFLEASRHIESSLREGMRTEFNSTLPRFDVLAALSRHVDGLKLSELSGVLRVSNGNVTGIVDRLTADGLIVRIPVPGDRRATTVRLTDKGEQEFAVQAQAHEQWVNELLSDFTAEEAASFSARLDKRRRTAVSTRGSLDA